MVNFEKLFCLVLVRSTKVIKQASKRYGFKIQHVLPSCIFRCSFLQSYLFQQSIYKVMLYIDFLVFLNVHDIFNCTCMYLYDIIVIMLH